MAMKNYDPSQVNVSIVRNGDGVSIMLDGFADGESIKVERPEANFVYEKDFKGAVGSRTKMPNKSGKFTFILQHTSDGNAALNDFFEADFDNPDGSNLFTVTVKDNFGADASIGGGAAAVLYQGSDCWIDKLPDSAYNNSSVSSREWSIMCNDLDYNL